MMASLEDAKATVEFAILNQLVGRVPAAANNFLQEISRVAASAVEESATAWAFEQVARASSPTNGETPNARS